MTTPQPVDTDTRLNQLEDEFETVKQLLISAASYAESADKRIDRLSERQDITQRQLDGLAVTVQVMGETGQSMGEKVDNFVTKVDDSLDRLTRKIDDFVETTTARNAVVNNVVLELRDSQQSINASLARMEFMILQLHNLSRSKVPPSSLAASNILIRGGKSDSLIALYFSSIKDKFSDYGITHSLCSLISGILAIKVVLPPKNISK